MADSNPEMNKFQIEANGYLTSKNIPELFSFLVEHLLAHEPDDPVEFLISLLDRCKMFREATAEPPLLFSERDVESIFEAMDPGKVGTISMDQYKTSMATLAVWEHLGTPVTDEQGRVSKQAFVENFIESLVTMLKNILKMNWTFKIQSSFNKHSKNELNIQNSEFF